MVQGKENLQNKARNDSVFLADLDVFTVCAERRFSPADRSPPKKFLCFSLSKGDTIGFLQFPCKPFLPASRFVTLKSFGPVLTKFGYNPVAKRYRRFVLTLLVSNSFVLISNLKDKGYVTTKKSLLIEKQTVWGSSFSQKKLRFERMNFASSC